MRMGTADFGYMGGLLLRYSHICVSVCVYSYKYWVHEGYIEESLSVVGSCQDALSPDILHVSLLSPSSILCSSPTVGLISEKGCLKQGREGGIEANGISWWEGLLQKLLVFYVAFTLVYYLTFIYLLLKIIFWYLIEPRAYYMLSECFITKLSIFLASSFFFLLADSLVCKHPQPPRVHVLVTVFLR